MIEERQQWFVQDEREMSEKLGERKREWEENKILALKGKETEEQRERRENEEK